MEIGFDGRTVIVTGAGNGLGRAYALELARRGAGVVVNDLGTSISGEGASMQVADAVVHAIVSAGGRAVASYDSVATDDGSRSIAATALDAFGRIDAVVHNAGIMRSAMFDDMTDELWSPVVETHLSGAFHLSSAVWPVMRRQGYGRLVFASSAGGAFGESYNANYAAAKTGVLGLCNALAIEGEEHGILANAILPWAFTRLSAIPRPGEEAADPEALREARHAVIPRFDAEWVAPMVAYLASEACTHTHGYYSTGGGRYSRVFIGATAGWRPEADVPPSAEDIAAHVGKIDDRRDFDVPMSSSEELRLLRARYG